MTQRAHDLSDAELETLADELGRAVTRGELAREAAIGELLDRSDGGITPVGAAESIDHWCCDLPDYEQAFTDLVGPVEAFVAMPPDERTRHAYRLLCISLLSDDIKRLGRDVADGRRTRADAAAELRTRAGQVMSVEDAGRLLDDWATAGIRHSRATRYLTRLINDDTRFPAEQSPSPGSTIATGSPGHVAGSA